jgi:hypothetical protein
MNQTGFLHQFDTPQLPVVLPEVGRISVGEFVPGEGQKRGYPKSLDHFRIYKADKATAAAFRAAYGDKPSEIKVSFLSSDPMQVCRTQYEIRCGSVKYAWGDGRVFTRWDPAQRKNVAIQVNSAAEQNAFMAETEQAAKVAGRAKGLKSIGEIKWRTSLTLRVWLPDVGVPGTWQFTTGGSATSIQAISGTFRTVLLAAKTVQFLPFRLKVQMHKGGHDGGQTLSDCEPAAPLHGRANCSTCPRADAIPNDVWG